MSFAMDDLGTTYGVSITPQAVPIDTRTVAKPSDSTDAAVAPDKTDSSQNESQVSVAPPPEDSYEISQKALSYNPNSIVEIKIAPPDADDKPQAVKPAEEKQPTHTAQDGSGIKQAAIQSIKENPVESVHLQIKNLDKNLLLAMISLRGA